jgi:16S rRNA (guanine1207-N2)-methyltransferase
MTQLRLEHALDIGAVDLPAGRIAVFAPRAGTDLPFAPETVQVVTSFRPDHDWFLARGYDCVRSPSGEFAAALVFLPRARDAARGQIALAAATVPGKPVFIEGERTDGVDSLWRELRSIIEVESLSKSHGRLLWLTAPETPVFAAWSAAAAPRDIGGWQTAAGVFSADGPDAGSELLLSVIPALKGRVADLGAGWGYLSANVLTKSEAISEMHLVEADAAALDCAKVNVTDARAKFHWADALKPLPGAPYDAIIMNPPFHQSRTAEPELGRRFIAAAAASLTPGGTLWLVANRHLGYDALLAELFNDLEPLPGNPSFKLFRAARPRRKK